jgi:internalin A
MAAMSRDELLALIDQAEADNREELDLSGMGLTELPAEIGKLTGLRKLVLGKVEKWKWVNGKLVPTLVTNQLTAWPEELQQLSQLRKLDLSGNPLGHCPDWLEKLGLLEQLRLTSIGLSEIPDSIASLTNLTHLWLDSNQITAIPDSIAALTNLTTLRLDSNQITSIPDSIASLTNLTRLWLSSNQITSIPDSIAPLTNLTHLGLSSNQITSIPDSIGQLIVLEGLYLSNNQITTIPDSIGQLKNLVRLDLYKNQLTSIPCSIGQLLNLIQLWLFDNRLGSIPGSVCQILSLEWLNLAENQIQFIPDCIGQLTNLTDLEFDHNQIKSIPDSIASLTNLTDLRLDSNQITAIPGSIAALTNLTMLDLEKNRITEIPACLATLPNLSQLDLRGNPLSVPKDILNSDAETRERSDRPAAKPILDYYFTTRDPNEITHLYEAKLLIVGEGESGKTSLAKKLINPDAPLQPHPTTHGIDILRWDYSHQTHNYRIHIWDFGGQEIYHATHQFFLTENSLYLLVADSRKEDTDHHYWLNTVRLLSNNSPAILVQNEKDDRKCALNLPELRHEFNNLHTPDPVNLKDDRGLPDLRKTIQRQLEDLLGPGIPFPNKWLAIRNSLENDKNNSISLQDYQAICRRHGLTDDAEMLRLSKHLHHLGTCLHFQNDRVLDKTIILKPNWATAALYKVLDNNTVKTNLGQFNQTDLADIWRDRQYATLHHELLQLMMQFKVCYEIPNRSGHYIAPHLLSSNSPSYDWDDRHNLTLCYRYNGFMLKGILTRFIVERHKDIENVSCPDQALVWRTGCILLKNNNRAEIIEDNNDREIQIRVSGPRPRDLLVTIHDEFEKIHDSFGEQLKYDILVPCNCTECKSNPKPFTFTLDLLTRRLDKGIYKIECHESGEDVQVRGLIDGVIAIKTDHPEFGFDRFELGLDPSPGRSKKAAKPKTRKPKVEQTVQPIVIENHSHNHIHTNNNQEQTMTEESKYSNDLKGANIANFANEVKDNARQQANQHNYAPSQNLTEAAKDIKTLIDQLSTDYDTTTPSGKRNLSNKILEVLEGDTPIQKRALNALKEMGKTALEEAIDHPVAKVLVAGLEGYIE